MPTRGRTPRCGPLDSRDARSWAWAAWTALVLVGLFLSSLSAAAEYRVFRVNVTLARAGDDPSRGPDYFLAGGAVDGLRVGQRMEIYRDEVVLDPVTEREHAIRRPVGEIVLISVDATAAIARRTKLVSQHSAPLLRHHAVMIGDVAVPVAEVETGESAEPGAATPVQAALTLELPSSILFDLDSAELKSAAAAELSGVEDALHQYPDHHLIVEGHTCDLGSRAHNEKLSLARARSVASFLSGRFGVPVDRMTVVGYGPNRPANPSSSVDARARNRRVELRFVTPPVSYVSR